MKNGHWIMWVWQCDLELQGREKETKVAALNPRAVTYVSVDKMRAWHIL